MRGGSLFVFASLRLSPALDPVSVAGGVRQSPAACVKLPPVNRRVSVGERRARLARRHLLLPEVRTDDVEAVADSLVAVHSSDPVTVYLSVLARMANPAVAAVGRALYVQRSVLRHHAMRRTLWVASVENTRYMHASVNDRLAAVETRRTVGMLATNGVEEPAAWLAAAKVEVLEVLRAEGAMTARELGRRIPALARPLVLAPGKSYQGKTAAHTRVLLVLGFEGAVVRTRPTGTWINGQYTWAAVDSWVPGGIAGHDERDACRALAERWLRAFGPAPTSDLAWWTGWTLAATRRALTDAKAVEVALDEGQGWLAAGDADPVDAAEPWVGVLPGLDATTMGWKDRGWYLPAGAADAFDRNGNAGPTLWVDGQVVGAWAQRPDGTTALHWFSAVPKARQAQVRRRVEELEAWLGDTRYSVRFPGRVQARLLGSEAPSTGS